MTPPARAQAAIDILDEVIASAHANGPAADTLIVRYFKARRYAGSKDRRAVRELVYAAVRRAGEVPGTGRAALIGLADDAPDLAPLFDGSVHGPAPVDADAPRSLAAVAPAWLAAKLAWLGPAELAALLDRAPLDLRANRLKATRAEALAAIGAGEAGTLAPDAIRLPEGFAIEAHPAWQQGLVEVQDEGSQLIVAAGGAQPGMMVVDLCAGAGGKTLGLAAAMANQGRLIACDTDRARLQRLPPRAQRAGVTLIESRLLNGPREAEGLADLAGLADVVLVDAPCSGSGTWRRNPEARWRLTPDRLARLGALQDRVLALAAPLVKPGGRLVYAVCSLLDEEGADRIAPLVAGGGWRLIDDGVPAGRPRGPGRLLTPARDGTDGFFIAVLERTC